MHDYLTVKALVRQSLRITGHDGKDNFLLFAAG